MATAQEIPFAYEIELGVPIAYRSLLTDNLDIYRWQNRPEMNAGFLQLLIDKTPAQIRELLETEGFYSPLVEIQTDPKDPKTVVRINVETGESVHIAALELQVQGAFDDGSEENRMRLQQMRNEWLLPVGSIFRHEGWEKAKRSALLPLIINRYPTARITDSSATIEPSTHEAKLTVIIDSGPAFVFGNLLLEGLERYPREIVDRFNPIRPGEPFSQAKLLDFQSRLRDSPYFASASVTADFNEAQENKAHVAAVYVRVMENPSRKFSIGAGLSTDAGPRGSLLYGDLNILDRAWRLSTSMVADFKRQTLGADLNFLQTENNERYSLYTQLERTDIEDQITQALKLGVKRIRLRGRNESITSLDYTTERQHVTGSKTETNQALTANYSWVRRMTDDILYPTRGYIINFQIGGGTELLLSEQDFLRLYGRGIWFYHLWQNGQLILRTELGTVLADSRRGIPSDFLFRTSGDQSIRGYAYQSLGIQEGDAVVGGRRLVVASAEYVQWLRPKWGAAVFYDAGDAADSWNDIDFNRGYGIGVRWRSPVGPLNLDVAYSPDREDFRLHFSVSMVF
ncbi:MAG: outer membrane protein assembly factor [Syntrophaceae bacterium]|nr:outer membrane protein assembly factor [Syntrophaceae bacterium]